MLHSKAKQTPYFLYIPHNFWACLTFHYPFSFLPLCLLDSAVLQPNSAISFPVSGWCIVKPEFGLYERAEVIFIFRIHTLCLGVWLFWWSQELLQGRIMFVVYVVIIFLIKSIHSVFLFGKQEIYLLSTSALVITQVNVFHLFLKHRD